MSQHWQVIGPDGRPMATVPTIGEALTLARPHGLNIRRITPGEPPLTMRSSQVITRQDMLHILDEHGIVGLDAVSSLNTFTICLANNQDTRTLAAAIDQQGDYGPAMRHFKDLAAEIGRQAFFQHTAETLGSDAMRVALIAPKH